MLQLHTFICNLMHEITIAVLELMPINIQYHCIFVMLGSESKSS